MKNFKLLLATTAILSAGAFIANVKATGPQPYSGAIEIPVSVAIQDYLTYEVIHKLDFGNIASNALAGTTDLPVIVNAETGDVTGSGVYLGGAARGQVHVLGHFEHLSLHIPASLELGYDIPLDMEESEFEHITCGTVESFSQYKVGDEMMSGRGTFYIGGTFKQAIYSDLSLTKDVECNGTLTVTLINNGL